jgi:hypothetical protein
MRIAVLGSWKPTQDGEWRGTRKEFIATCEEIGRELARHEQTLIVGSESPDTADAHVVQGMLTVISASPNNRSRIEVVCSTAGRQPFADLITRFKEHISFPPIPQSGWTETILLQVKEADALLTVAGGSGTYHAGLAAIVAKKTLVPIAGFGGASSRLAKAMLSFGDQLRAELGVLSGPWSSHVLDTAIRLLGVGRMPRLLIIHGKSNDRYMLTEWLRTTFGQTDLLIMQEQFGGGLSLPEKFEKIAAKADGAIALATPDDSIGDPHDTRFRARQNVWLEVGWIWGKLGRHKVMLLTKGQLENPSDIQGIEYYSYSNSPLEAGESIRKFMGQLSANK